MIFVLLLIWGAWPPMSTPKERERFQQEQDVMDWIDSCPKDAALSGKSIYHADQTIGEMSIIILVCKSVVKDKETIL